MKVLIISDPDTKYGAPKSLFDTIIALKTNHDLDITVLVTRNSDIVRKLRNAGCNVIVLLYNSFYNEFPTWKQYWKFPLTFVRQGLRYFYGRMFAEKRLRRAVRIEDFDLIHANSSREDFGALLSEKYHIPLVWHIREYGDIHSYFYSFRKNYIELMNRASSVMVAVSDAAREHWIQKGIDREKIIRIYDGVEPIKLSKQKHIPLNQKQEIRLVMTGSIQPIKGQEQAIRLLGKLKDSDRRFHLDLIGDGPRPYIHHLKQLIRQYQIEDAVSFLGYRNDVPELLPNYDVGLVCGKGEGFGRTTVEYMMAGLPVLASDTGANPELVRNGIDGYIYSYDNLSNMKTGLCRIIDEDLGGHDTQRYAVETFSSFVNAESIYSLYMSIYSNQSMKNIISLD